MATRDKLPYPDDDFALMALMSARIAATRLNDDTLDEFTQQIINRLAATGPQPHLEKWLSVIQEGPKAVKDLMLDPSEYGRYMRSLIPFRAFVSPVERSEIIHRVHEIVREHSMESA